MVDGGPGGRGMAMGSFLGNGQEADVRRGTRRATSF